MFWAQYIISYYFLPAAQSLCNSSTYPCINFHNTMLNQMFLEAFLKIRFHPAILESCSFGQKWAEQHKSHFTLSESFMFSCRYPGGSGRWNPASMSWVSPWGLLSVSRAQNIEPPLPTPLNEVKQWLDTEHPLTVKSLAPPAALRRNHFSPSHLFKNYP